MMMAVCSDGRWRVNERPVLDREEEDVWDPGEPLRYPIRDHFGRSGQKWSGRVWGSLASNSKIPSATTSVGLDESGPAEWGFPWRQSTGRVDGCLTDGRDDDDDDDVFSLRYGIA